MYTLDTNIIIYYLNAFALIEAFVNELLSSEMPIYVSTATEHELYAYGNLTETEAKNIAALLNSLTLVPVDSDIAQLSGGLKRFYGIKSMDSIIAATALITRSTLVTRNIRDFRSIPQLQIHAL